MIAVESGRMIREFLVGSTGLTVGLAVFLGAENVGLWRRYGGLYLAHARADFGYAITMTLIVELLYRAPTIPYSWRVGVFMVGVVLILTGFIPIGRDAARGRRGERRRGERRGR